MSRTSSLLIVFLIAGFAIGQELTDAERRKVVEERRSHEVQIIVHRGVSTLARENTLRAYRYSLELGADGNEIDIRATRDGVLVVFHDDMLDQHLDAFGDVADYDWDQLREFPFRIPKHDQEEDSIPTLEEVFLLHRRYGGLMHLDVKRPGLEKPIIEMLDRLDLWDQVVAVNTETAPGILEHPRYHGGQYKGSLYQDHAEFDPQAIAAMFERPGNMVIVDDPRGVLVALGRTLGKLQRSGHQQRIATQQHSENSPQSEQKLLEILQENKAWDEVPKLDSEQVAKASAILGRAIAAEQVRKRKLRSTEFSKALETLVRERSLHPQWMYHGLDGASALRTLGELQSPSFVELARYCLWRNDPVLESLKDPRWKTPGSWMDFRTKMIVFPLVEKYHTPQAEQLCRDYLALSDEQASEIGPLQFESAGRALLEIIPDAATAIQLLQHRRGDVRGAAIIECLQHLDDASTWANEALAKAAPYALKYRVTVE